MTTTAPKPSTVPTPGSPVMGQAAPRREAPPVRPNPIVEWITTTDHKRIGYL